MFFECPLSVFSQKRGQKGLKSKKKSTHAPYWNRTSDLIITSDTLYHLANGASLVDDNVDLN